VKCPTGAPIAPRRFRSRGGNPGAPPALHGRAARPARQDRTCRDPARRVAAAGAARGAARVPPRRPADTARRLGAHLCAAPGRARPPAGGPPLPRPAPLVRPGAP